MNNKKKKIIIASLLGLVVCLGIGFAAFSTTLKINGSAKVSPDGENYKVFFVSSVDSLTRYDRGDFDGETNSDKVDPGQGHFENDTTFTNTGVTFTEDGQSVDYKFYILNAGKYDAHITNLDIGKKTCTPGEDADPTLAQAACDLINLSVILGDEGNQTTFTSSQAISDHVLPKGTWEQIIVRITYPEGSPLVDGNLEVTWKDISFFTATSATYTPPKPESNMQILSGDLETIGSEVAIGSEHFYVIGNNEDDSSKVNLLAKYNLNVGNYYKYQYNTTQNECESSGGEWIDNGKDTFCYYDGIISDDVEGYNLQSEKALGNICDEYLLFDDKDAQLASFTQSTKNTVLSSLSFEQIESIEYIDCHNDLGYFSYGISSFSEFAYWSDGEQWNSPLKVQYGTNYDEKPYIYDANSNFYYYIEKYKSLLENTYDIDLFDARLLSYQEATNLGCDGEVENCLTSAILDSDRLWIINTSFYLGSARSGREVWGIYFQGSFDGHYDISDTGSGGIRPVITVSKDIFE